MGHRDEDDDDSGEYEKPRKKSVVPTWAWVLLATGGALAVCCGGFLSTPWLIKVAASVKQTDGANSRPVAPGEEVRVGDIGVTVLSCREEQVDSTSASGREMLSRQPHTVITIRLKNYNPAKNASPEAQSPHATVTDDLGNQLARVHITNEIGLENKVEGQIEDGKALVLRSDRDGSDKLIVSRAVPAAKSVTVNLDATCYGGRGHIVVSMPIRK